MKTVLVVAVHPDDESLGAGGALLRHKAQGDQIHWLILTCPMASAGYSDEYIENRKRTIEQVAQAYGFNSVTELKLPATGLAEISEKTLVQAVSETFSSIAPNIVYTPFHSDVHGDHKAAFTAVYSCTKPFRYPFIEKVLMIETISETDQAVAIPAFSFVPNVFIDITPYLEHKLEILELYKTEMHPPPFPRSLEAVRALARVRGATIQAHYAEAFMLLKEVVR
jgi:N-acetylglucosamine malate deacetylase 1